MNEVLYGHATHLVPTTEYVDGYVYPTSTGYNVAIEVTLESNVGIGTLSGEGGGSAVWTSPTTSSGVWHMTGTGGTGKFEGATSKVTVYVNVTREWVNFPIVHNSVVVTKATGWLSY